jgi:DNA-directed RNA polymerase specialized sigma24 family protein
VKRGSGVSTEPLEHAEEVSSKDDVRILEVNEALARLKLLNMRLAQVVECRFFAGYDELQTAEALGLTDRTVRRDWVKARAWLRRELADSEATFAD